jgi:hypothetical protein
MWNVDAKVRVGGAINVRKGGKCGPHVDHKSKNVEMWERAPPNIATYVDVLWRFKKKILKSERSTHRDS